MDLLADLKRIVEEHLNAFGISYSSSDEVEKLLLLTLNQELKAVSRRPRRVFRSPEFAEKLSALVPDQLAAAEAIVAKFTSGDDVTGHLSKSSTKPELTDTLLADWQVHHLHISNHRDKPTDKFYSRTGPVMFAHITSDSVHFIDIYSHGAGYPEAWTRQELLRILDKSWPHILDPYRVKGITGLAFAPSDLDLKQLRGAQVNSIVQVGSSFIAPPGGGLATDGTPFNNVFRMNRTIKVIKKLERVVTANSAQFKTEIAAKSGLAEGDLDFQLVSLGSQWGIIEKTTGLLVARSS